VFGALGLRPPIAEHTNAEAELLMRYAAGAETVIELGVAEGASAAELRSVMSATGRLYLIDPYEAGTLSVNMARIVARRTVAKVDRGDVRWLKLSSGEAAKGWDLGIDFLFIDADHSYERARDDWEQWTPHVRIGGCVALHDSAVFAGGWTSNGTGPVRLVGEIRTGEPSFTMIDQADSLTILRRIASN
jgi:predicted O-methyltransferase YrrM